MVHFIDKSALVAELKKRIDEHNSLANAAADNNLHNTLEANELLIRSYKNLMSFINTLEVKEVDLEKTLIGFQNKYAYENSGELPSAIEIAKYFFELGLCVNNPITAADRGIVEEIIINLKRVEQDYHIDLTREMEWLRNKVKKGE